jgi:hypothetical protein
VGVPGACTKLGTKSRAGCSLEVDSPGIGSEEKPSTEDVLSRVGVGGAGSTVDDVSTMVDT